MKTNWFSKKGLSLVLALAMVLSLVPLTPSTVKATETMTVYVTVSDKGNLAKDKNGDYVANVPVTVSYEEGVEVTLNDVLAQFHEDYYTEGSLGYSIYDSGAGYWVTTFWGDTSGSYSFYRNNVMTATVDAETVEDGDSIVAFIWADTEYWSDQYVFFDNTVVNTAIGEEVNLTLKGYSYDESWNTVIAPVAGAELTIFKVGEDTDFVATGVTTDENGAVSYVFNEDGTYLISATKDDATITAPACVVYIPHEYVTTVNKATTKENGSIVKTCKNCGRVETTSISKIKSVTLSKTSYVYNGKAKTPAVTVKDAQGKIISSDNYTVKYKNNTNVNKATVTVTFKGNYSGTVVRTFKILPKATKVKSLVAKKKALRVNINKVSKQISGYQIQYSTTRAFKASNTKSKKVGRYKTFTTIKNLKSGKKYYVRIRTYKKVSGKTYYSAWSKAVSKKTK